MRLLMGRSGRRSPAQAAPRLRSAGHGAANRAAGCPRGSSRAAAMMAADDSCKGSGGSHRCRRLGDYCIERVQRCGHDAGAVQADCVPW